MSSAHVVESGKPKPVPAGVALLSLLTDSGISAELAGSFSQELWSRIAEQAQLHRVHPLLLRALRQGGLQSVVPAETLATLEAAAAQAAASWLLRSHELSRIARAMTESAIPTMVLKGAQLAEEIYPSPVLRAMGDIDLMVPPQHLAAAGRMLRDLGYVCEAPYDIETVFRERCELPVHVGAARCAIDLHWNIEKPTAGFAIDVAGLWQRARPSICASGLLALSVEDQLLHLALHTVFHHGGQAGLIGFVDAALLCRRHPIGWAELAERARTWRMQTAAYAFLKVTRQQFGAAIPEWLLEQLGSGQGDRTAAELLGSLTDAKEQITRSGNYHRVRHIRKIRQWDGTFKAAIRLLADAFSSPSKDLDRFRHLPGPLKIAVSYPSRWLRVIVSLASSSARACRSSLFRTQMADMRKILDRQQALTRLSAPARAESADRS